MPRRKRFGQHFLRDDHTLDRLVDAIAPSANDCMIEIGPGDGALTQRLAARVAHLDILEIDTELTTRLDNRFRNDPVVNVIGGDALAFDYETHARQFRAPIRIVGNIAYNISSPLIFRLLGVADGLRDIHFMLQKEVVDRLVAAPGGRRYGRLTVGVGACAQASHLFDVPPDAFDPPPRVDSAVVRITRAAPAVPLDDTALFDRLVANAFSRRRKTLRNALAEWDIERIAKPLGIDISLRPEQLAPVDYIRLANTYRTISDRTTTQ